MTLYLTTHMRMEGEYKVVLRLVWQHVGGKTWKWLRVRNYKYENMVFNMALGYCIHVYRPDFGPHQYSVNHLWLKANRPNG